MSKQHKVKRNAAPPSPPSGDKRIPRAMFIAVAVVVVASLGYASWKSRNPGIRPAAPPTAGITAANPPAAVPVVKPDFQSLKGRWLRPDGGYIIDVRSVDESGRMDAAYLNPQPIHVASAEASMDGAAMKVFIELRDVNYPGSTYTLTYDRQGDQLKGIYYQALQQQHFEVAFMRMNDQRTFVVRTWALTGENSRKSLIGNRPQFRQRLTGLRYPS